MPRQNNASAPAPTLQRLGNPAPATAPFRPTRRARWLKTLLQWHWISSALCLVGMLMFAVTGITLNHAGAIEARAKITVRDAALPAALHHDLRARAAALTEGETAPLPAQAIDWTRETLRIALDGHDAEWSRDEAYIPLLRPGGDAWLRFDLAAGEAHYELTDRGWIAWLNDLHKGRNTGPVWGGFIDILAAGCVVFSITGLLILSAHARRRALAWPTVALGLVVPALLLILFTH